MKIVIYVYIVTFILTGCSNQTTATEKLSGNIATVGIQVKGSQRTMKMNDQIILPISIHNNGIATIPSKGKPDGSMIVLATYHWIRTDGSIVVWDGIRTKLSEDIRQDKSLDLPLTVKSPPEPGKHILIIDLVQEGAQWFADTGSQTATMAFTIEK